MSVIDEQGFRANVGIILLNQQGQAFWGRRKGMQAWQFPQGGLKDRETPADAMFRELEEEVGLAAADVELVGETLGWMRYRLPRRYIRFHQKPVCVGQKQRWFVLRLTSGEQQVDLTKASEPEFDHWRWIAYWDALNDVVDFKRAVYSRALNELAPVARQCTDGLVSINPPG